MSQLKTNKVLLGQRLIEVRKKLGHENRKNFAPELGTSSDTLGTYERGIAEPNISLLTLYHQKFGVNLSWLITGKGEMFDDPAQTMNHAPKMHAAIMKKLAQVVMRIYQDANIKIMPDDVSAEATELYHDLAKRVDDMSDIEEVEAAFPQLEVRLKKRLAEARANPGAGKREAS